jgi:predicted ATPase
MQEARNITVPSGSSFGPLASEFRYDLRRGYTALVGPNNVGKSTILQLIFRSLVADPEFGPDHICLIRPDRQVTQTTAQPGADTLNQWNAAMLNELTNRSLVYGPNTSQGPPMATLPRVILHRTLMPQMRKLEELFPRLGFPAPDLVGGQEFSFEALSVAVQGSGLRTIFPILAALSDSGMKAILIDEPELSLEPRLQKVVRDLLVEVADQGCIVVISTHSHLFLNRLDPESTQVVERREGVTSVTTVDSGEQLQSVTFDLLGSSTEDLFFPRNYIVVEGASDQEFVAKTLELLGVPVPMIKVLSAGGIDAVGNTIEAVRRALVPVVVNDSPYAKRIVAMIDQPKGTDLDKVDRLHELLGERLHILDSHLIEDYVPPAIYERAGRSKEADIKRIRELHGRYNELREVKNEISRELAAELTVEDLNEIPIVRDAAQQAIDLSHGA